MHIIPQKKEIIIGLFFIITTSSVLADDNEVCKVDTSEDFQVCYINGSLTRIIELNSQPNKSLSLALYLGSNNTIAPYAFNNSQIMAFNVKRVENGSHYPISLSILPNSFAGMQNLKILGLRYVNFKLINNNPMVPLESLENLGIMTSNLTEVPVGFLASFPNLRYMKIIGNRISTIRSKSFASLERLETLSLSANRITHIEAGAFNGLSKLRKINLSNNYLTLSPGIFRGMTNLREIKLENAFSSNETRLDVHIFDGLPELTTIVLKRNNFKDLPVEGFSNLESLDYLDLSHNKFRTIRPGTFGCMDLVGLYLGHNKIKVIETDTFDGLTLDELCLDHDHIEELKPRAFNGLQVDRLDLRGNKLTKIGVEDFEGLLAEILVLSNNDIKTIARGAFDNDGVPYADELEIYSNPITESITREDLGLPESVKLNGKF